MSKTAPEIEHKVRFLIRQLINLKNIKLKHYNFTMSTKRKFTEKEIIAVVEKKLPKIIEKHPEVERKIEKIIEKKTATKDDIKAILLQIEKNREDTNKRFEVLIKEMRYSFEVLDKKLRQGYQLLVQDGWGIYAEETFRCSRVLL